MNLNSKLATIEPQRAVRYHRQMSVMGFNGEQPAQLVWLLLGYAALFLIRPWEYKPELAILPWERIYAIMLILAVVMLIVSRPNTRLFGPSMMAWFAFLVFMTISWAFSINAVYSWITLEFVLKLTVFGLCLELVLKRRADLRLFTLGWSVILFLYQAKSLQEHLMFGRGVYRMGTWRLIGIESTFGNPNSFAATTVFMLPLIFWLLHIERRKSIRFFLIMSIILAVFVVIRTGSRGGLLLLVIYLLYAIFRSRRKILYFSLLMVATLVAALTMPDDIVRRYKTMVDPTVDASAQESAEGRQEGFERGLFIARHLPITGVGPGCTVIAHMAIPQLTDHFGAGSQAHNLLGQLLGELGYVGGVVWFGFFFTLLGTYIRVIRSGRARRDRFMYHFGQAGLEIVVLLFLFGLVGHNLFRYTWIWMAALGDVALRIADRPLPRKVVAGSGFRPTPSS